MKYDYKEFRPRSGNLYYQDSFLLEAQMTVVKEEIICNSGEPRSDKAQFRHYLVRVEYSDGRDCREVWLDDLRNIDFWDKFQLNDAAMDKKSRDLVTSKLLYEAAKAEKEYVFRLHSGLQMVNKTPVYLMGRRVIMPLSAENDPTIRFQDSMGRDVERADLSGTIEEENILAYLQVFPGTSEILFYASLYAVVKPFLSRMNIDAGFLVALIGPSGHMKTTLCRQFALWLEPDESQESGFYQNVRNRTILDEIGKYRGMNYLVDDFHMVMDQPGRVRQRERLDQIARYVVSERNCANVIITAETLEEAGVLSCQDRILQIPFPRLPDEELRKLKQRDSGLQPMLMRDLSLWFALKLLQNYETVMTDIRSYYDRNMTGSAAGVYRVNRWAAFLRLTEWLFRKYFLGDEGKDLCQQKFETALLRLVQVQEEAMKKLREKAEQPDYIVGFSESLSHNYIKVLHDPGEYIIDGKVQNKTCFLDSKCRIYITSGELRSLMVRRYQRLIQLQDIVRQFHGHGILEEESGSGGFQKNFKGIKHYVISIPMMVLYLQEHGCSVPDGWSELLQYL